MIFSITTILYFTFSFFILFSSLMVITGYNSNPIQAVLYLILSFINSAGLLMLLEIEYIALIFIMIQVGAIAILFLFVIMMLNIKVFKSRDIFNLMPISFIIFFCFFSILVYSLSEFRYSINQYSFYRFDYTQFIDSFSTLDSLGQFLYTQGVYQFLVSGIILLIAMIGAISLTRFNKN